ncbi:MAG: 30S ribosomal protein S19 [Patescibacteria group bacterium]
MARSLKKGPYIDERVMKKLKDLKPGTKAIIKTWSRSCVIAPEMVGFTFGVHNGKEHVAVFVSEDMVGHKLGEFSPTTKFGKHGGRMQRDIEAGAAEKEAIKPAAPVAPAPKKK